MHELPGFGGQPFAFYIQGMFAPGQIGDLGLDLVALRAQGLEFLVMAGGGGLQLVSFGGHVMQRMFYHGGHCSRVIGHALQVCGLLASAIVQRLDAGAAFGGFSGVVPQQPGLPAQ